MIVLLHDQHKAVDIIGHPKLDELSSLSIAEAALGLAKDNPDELIIWCHKDLYEVLNTDAFQSIFCRKRTMASFSVSEKPYLPEALGYVDQSPFINVNYNVRYPTFLMSSDVGGIYGDVLWKFSKFKTAGFDYFLNTVAKLGQPKGLFCYSEPRLLSSKKTFLKTGANTYSLFKFVGQHYKKRWLLLLAFAFFNFERRVPFLPFLIAIFYKQRTGEAPKLEAIYAEAFNSQDASVDTIDVIIPTIGRKTYLYDTLCDFAKQTHLPKKVIIVEQNPDKGSTSELDYLETEHWPFEIVHHFIHQTGACNARNLALKEVTSDWVFLADDDNLFQKSLIKGLLDSLKHLNARCITTSYLQAHECEIHTDTLQWPTFGAGNSVMQSSLIKNCYFNLAYEYGYGEDADFGMQLRNNGVDIFYNPHLKITHLKAPVGGFREILKKPWDADETQPKPSPTVMLYQLKHHTIEQIKGYKQLLFFKFYRKQRIKNPFHYIRIMKTRWNDSVKWAIHLDKKHT